MRRSASGGATDDDAVAWGAVAGCACFGYQADVLGLNGKGDDLADEYV